jgi:hypothetical protein
MRGPQLTAEQAAAAAMVAEARQRGLELTGPNGLLKLFTKSVLATALGEEMTEHLGHEKNKAESGRESARPGSAGQKLCGAPHTRSRSSTTMSSPDRSDSVQPPRPAYRPPRSRATQTGRTSSPDAILDHPVITPGRTAGPADHADKGLRLPRARHLPDPARSPAAVPLLPQHHPAQHLFKPVRRLIESVNDAHKGQLNLECHAGRTTR